MFLLFDWIFFDKLLVMCVNQPKALPVLSQRTDVLKMQVVTDESTTEFRTAEELLYMTYDCLMQDKLHREEVL